jgi:pimeloyl-ACP methyl ester carboxylesterase
MSEKTSLILVPGLLCTEALFEAQVTGLGDIAEITVTPEHRRHETIGHIADAILADAPPRFALGGLSMGGYIAFEIMRRAPERVIGLSLLDTSARADTPERTAEREGLIELASKGKFVGVSENLVKSFIHPNRHKDETLISAVRAMAKEVGRDDFLRQQKAVIGRSDSRADLAAVTCPTVVICGKHDAVTPPELSQEIADGIPGAELEIIQFCGHLTTMERPALTNAALRRWLERL